MKIPAKLDRITKFLEDEYVQAIIFLIGFLLFATIIVGVMEKFTE